MQRQGQGRERVCSALLQVPAAVRVRTWEARPCRNACTRHARRGGHLARARVLAAAPHRLGPGPAPQHVAPTARRGARPGHAPASAGPPACRVARYLARPPARATGRTRTALLARAPASRGLRALKRHRVRMPMPAPFATFANLHRAAGGETQTLLRANSSSLLDTLFHQLVWS